MSKMQSEKLSLVTKQLFTKWAVKQMQFPNCERHTIESHNGDVHLVYMLVEQNKRMFQLPIGEMIRTKGKTEYFINKGFL